MYLAFSVARMICGDALTKGVTEVLTELLTGSLTLRKLGEIRTAFFEEGREGFFGFGGGQLLAEDDVLTRHGFIDQCPLTMHHQGFGLPYGSGWLRRRVR